MKYYQLTLTKFAIAIFFLAIPLLSEASAQVGSAITFSRPDPSGGVGESQVSEIRFNFADADDVLVQIDQLSSANGSPFDALFQNYGQDITGALETDFGALLDSTNPNAIETIGVVAIGDTLTAGMDFVSTGDDVDNIISQGDDFFLGFSTGTNSNDIVGFFNVRWETGLNADIVYSGGRISLEGNPLEVVAVPEPGTLTLISALALAAFVRRRRG